MTLAMALVLGGTASRDTAVLAQDEPALNCSSCSLRHKDLQKRRNAPGICRIKGMISEAGARIYHLPGADGYAQTYIDLTRGGALVLHRGRGAGQGLERRSGMTSVRQFLENQKYCGGSHVS